MKPQDFWRMVNKHGPIPPHRPELGPCWLWTGALSEKGYGKLRHNGKNFRAHRFAHEMETGRALSPSVLVCHHCDTPPCVRDSHLFESTPLGNSRDAVSKGRMPKGEQAPGANLSIEAVRGAVARAVNGETCYAIAKSMNLSYMTLLDILTGKTWKGIADEMGYKHIKRAQVFNADQIKEIRGMADAGKSQRAIAKIFGVTQRAIWQILNRKFHKGVN